MRPTVAKHDGCQTPIAVRREEPGDAQVDQLVPRAAIAADAIRGAGVIPNRVVARRLARATWAAGIRDVRRQVLLEDVTGRRLVGSRHRHDVIAETTGPHQRRVQHVVSIRRRHDEDAATLRQPVELCEERVLHPVVRMRERLAAQRSYGVHLVEEDDDRHVRLPRAGLARYAKQLAVVGFGLPVPHRVERPRPDVHES